MLFCYVNSLMINVKVNVFLIMIYDLLILDLNLIIIKLNQTNSNQQFYFDYLNNLIQIIILYYLMNFLNFSEPNENQNKNNNTESPPYNFANQNYESPNFNMGTFDSNDNK